MDFRIQEFVQTAESASADSRRRRVPPKAKRKPRHFLRLSSAAAAAAAMKVKVKRIRAIASWNWNANDDCCGICRNEFEACCPNCRMPGDDCPPGRSGTFEETRALDKQSSSFSRSASKTTVLWLFFLLVSTRRSQARIVRVFRIFRIFRSFASLGSFATFGVFGNREARNRLTTLCTQHHTLLRASPQQAAGRRRRIEENRVVHPNKHAHRRVHVPKRVWPEQRLHRLRDQVTQRRIAFSHVDCTDADVKQAKGALQPIAFQKLIGCRSLQHLHVHNAGRGRPRVGDVVHPCLALHRALQAWAASVGLLRVAKPRQCAVNLVAHLVEEQQHRTTLLHRTS
eukprot:scaffold279_cov229-Pinguiococcus_pyrenoidosus.AAC.23